MPATAQKNRQIKKLLEQAFGHGKVRVTAGTGTARTWSYVNVTYVPRSTAEERTLWGKVEQLIAAAGIEVPYHSVDGWDRQMSIVVNFARPVIAEAR